MLSLCKKNPVQYNSIACTALYYTITAIHVILMTSVHFQTTLTCRSSHKKIKKTKQKDVLSCQIKKIQKHQKCSKTLLQVTSFQRTMKKKERKKNHVLEKQNISLDLLKYMKTENLTRAFHLLSLSIYIYWTAAWMHPAHTTGW